MNDLIRRQDAIGLVEKLEIQRLKGQIELLYAPTIKGLMALPSAQPTADVVEVVHGEWIYKNDNPLIGTGYWECSICGIGKLLHEENFCPNCGARMDGEK